MPYTVTRFDKIGSTYRLWIAVSFTLAGRTVMSEEEFTLTDAEATAYELDPASIKTIAETYAATAADSLARTTDLPAAASPIAQPLDRPVMDAKAVDAKRTTALGKN